MNEIILSAKDISKKADKDSGGETILSYIDVDLYYGDFTVIMGPSGAGKSTLLYCLSGMDNVSEGTVSYKGRDIARMKEREMAKLRADEFGFVFQQAALISNLTLSENILVSGYLGSKASEAQTEKRTHELINQMKICDAAERYPSQVSGGEAQRAALARAIINSPGIVFADEPTGALNRHTTEAALDIMTEIHRSGQSILMVTHDIRAALRANRILYLEDGKIAGELNLSEYSRQEAKEREQQISEWLLTLEW